jgi:hypothetical protein
MTVEHPGEGVPFGQASYDAVCTDHEYQHAPRKAVRSPDWWLHASESPVNSHRFSGRNTTEPLVCPGVVGQFVSRSEVAAAAVRPPVLGGAGGAGP